MRIKLYRSPNMAEAMARVRTELGQDALILGTRRVSEGVEVTAALEPAPPAPDDPARARILTWHGVPSALVERLAHSSLEQALERALCFGRLDFAAGAKPLLVMGPPGAGKTLTVARLATRLVVRGAEPLVISTDGQRAGADEQLAAFCRVLGLTLVSAEQPAALAHALLRRDRARPVLIDTAGIHAFDRSQAETIEVLAAIADAQCVAVLPAGLDPFEAADLAQALAASGARHMVATRLDLARRLGSVLAAADAGKLALTEAGIGPGASDGLVCLTPALLAERIEMSAPAESTR
jgi:flagellar biosynthesis protein FlhF